MSNFTIEGREYSARKLDAFGQFAIARKILPLFSAAAPAVALLLQDRGDKPFTSEDAALLLSKSEPIAQAIAHMPEPDFNGLIQACLSVVEFRGTDRQFHPLLADGILMLPLSMFEVLPIMYMVICENLRPTSAVADKLRTVAARWKE